MTRASLEAQAPPIPVESPAVGDEIRSPLRLRGTASVFEATFSADVTDRDGRIVVSKVVTASAGAPARGTFDVELPFEAEPGRGAVIVFGRSPADGARQHVVEIPVAIAR